MTAPAAAPRKRHTWDLVLTIVLLVAYLAGTAFASFLSFFLAFASDSCGASSVCDYDQMSTGMFIVLGGVWLPALFVLAGSIVLIVVKRLAFWVPLVGILLTVGIAFAGVSVVFAAVQPS